MILSADAAKKRHDVRPTESRLEPGDEAHVYGQRREVVEARDDLGDETVYRGDGDEDSGFRVSDSPPPGTSLRVTATGVVLVLLGVLLTGAFGFGTAAILGVV